MSGDFLTQRRDAPAAKRSGCLSEANLKGRKGPRQHRSVNFAERMAERLSGIDGVWEKEKFAEPSIIESYEPDRTKVIVEFEADESELRVKKLSEVVNAEVTMKKAVSEDVNRISDDEKQRIEGERGRSPCSRRRRQRRQVDCEEVIGSGKKQRRNPWMSRFMICWRFLLEVNGE